MIKALALVALAILTVGIITGNTALIIIGIILAVVALFIACADKIIGAAYWVGALICNIVIGIWNVVLGMGNSVCAIATNVGIAFQNAWIWAKNAFWEFVADVLDGVSKLEPVINGIASLVGKGGIDISGAASSARSKKSSYKEYVSVSDAWSNGFNTVDYLSLMDAYNKGSSVGSNIQDTVGGWGDDIIGLIGGLGDIGSMDVFNDLAAILTGGYNAGSYNLPSMDDPANALNTTPGKSPDDLLKDVGGIADDTGSIADSMKLSQEDLDYLRKIADMEWKREQTIAEIHVDMSNYNTINNESDLDGIVTKLADKLYDELSIVADGVYA